MGLKKLADRIPVILEAWYGGLELGNVIADILFGEVNPSGKLPVSWPKRKKDINTYFNFIQSILPRKEVVYDEGIFVGYRHYETNKIPVQWCFGHGLSYTTFEYGNLSSDVLSLRGEGTASISCSVKNTGKRDGAEIIQLYYQDLECSVPRPAKELIGFKKVFLKSGASEKVEFTVKASDLAFYDAKSSSWVTENGKFNLFIGSSIQDVRLEAILNFEN